jgi:Taurine catabolism dioxygenase TauD, TfdA family
MSEKISLININTAYSAASPFLLANETSYISWRQQKLTYYPTTINDLIVPIKNPYQLSSQEYTELLTHCRKTNFAIYEIDAQVAVDKSALQALTAQLGLHQLDHNLCADEDGIAALQVNTAGRSQEYIPYSNRPINWHTDGYYNTSEQQVRAVLLHCIRPALTGGDNQLLDHEIAYMQLRDENPDYIAALMANDVMTIPANVEQGTELRTAQSGPVFSIEPQTGALHMRYTARTRSIVWKSSTLVSAALTHLQKLFNEDSPYVFHCRLAPNQGIICNNILHNRSGFTDGDDPEQKRLLYRMRFYDRIRDTF